MHLSTDLLLRYHRKQLSDSEKREIELHLASCELCSEALNGVAEMNDAYHIHEITSELRKKLRKKSLYRKQLFASNELPSILLAFFILGLIILLAVYFLILKW